MATYLSKLIARPNLQRWLELLLVLGVAFGPSVLSSLYTVLSGKLSSTSEMADLRLVSTLLQQLLSLAVLAYVLSRQGRSLRSLDLTFPWQDIPISFLLVFFGYVGSLFFATLAYVGYYVVVGAAPAFSNPATALFQAGSPALWVVFMLVNAFFEELTVRAYMMSEVQSLTHNGLLAVFLSVGLQTLYHLYQGPVAALELLSVFLVFSLYYYRTRHIMPVILAHFCMDIIAVISLFAT